MTSATLKISVLPVAESPSLASISKKQGYEPLVSFTAGCSGQQHHDKLASVFGALTGCVHNERRIGFEEFGSSDPGAVKAVMLRSVELHHVVLGKPWASRWEG